MSLALPLVLGAFALSCSETVGGLCWLRSGLLLALPPFGEHGETALGTGESGAGVTHVRRLQSRESPNSGNLWLLRHSTSFSSHSRASACGMLALDPALFFALPRVARVRRCAYRPRAYAAAGPWTHSVGVYYRRHSCGMCSSSGQQESALSTISFLILFSFLPSLICASLIHLL